MDSDENVINKFANILKNRNVKPTTSLYCENKSNNSSREEEYEIKDVIASVSKQLKDIQHADRAKNYRNWKGNTNLVKKSNFLPVHKDPLEQDKHNTNKFETQCILDTQLINVIDIAEAIIDMEKGATQEFDTSFCLKDLNSNDNDEEKCVMKPNHKNAITKNYKTSEPQVLSNENDSSSVGDQINNNLPFSNKTVKDFVPDINVENKGTSDNFDIISKCYYDFHKDDVNSDEMEEDISISKTYAEEASFVLNHMQPTVKSRTPSPLICRLESFEKFESIALPVIKETIDFQTAKKLINSQIMNKDLFIQCHDEPVLGDRDKQLSPILNVSKKPIQEFGDASYKDKKRHPLKEDNILFSSDEEIDFHKKYEEIPLTCAIQSPCDMNYNDVVDKTMYVGFQTANNKSIEILTDSFNTAKGIFDNVTKIHRENESVTNSREVIDKNTQFNNNHIKNNKHLYCNNSSTLCNENSPLRDGFQITKYNSFKALPEISIKTNKDTSCKNDTSNENSKKTSDSNASLLNDYDIFDIKEINFLEEVDIKEKSDIDSTLNKMDSVKCSNIEKLNNSIVQNSALLSTADQGIFEVFNSNFIPDNGIQYKADKIIVDNIAITDIASKYSNVAKKESVIKDSLTECENISCNNLKEHTMKGQYQYKLKTDESLSIARPICNDFVGFKTASNKTVKVSAQALMKTKNIFDNIESEKSICHTIEKPIQIRRSFDKSATNKKEVNPLNKLAVKKVYNEGTNRRSADITNHHSVNNKRIKLPNLVQCDLKVIQDKNKDSFLCDTKTDDMQGNITIEPFECSNFKSSSVLQGFRTASGNPVAISKEALHKTKNIFQEINNTDETDKHLETIENHEGIFERSPYYNCNTLTNNIFEGFKTANNKPVQISESALAKTKNIFQDINIKDNKIINDIEDQTCLAKTADVSSLLVSDVLSMKKDINGIKPQDAQYHNNNSHDKLSATDDFAKTKSLQGFKTASNRTVKISKKALIKSRTFFQEVDQEVELCHGFKTAADKLVTISSDALAKSKNIFQELDMDYKRNQPKNILKEDLSRSNKLQEIDADNYSENKIVNKAYSDHFLKKTISYMTSNKLTNSVGHGFKTAANKPVVISAEALAKTKNMFQDMDTEYREKQITNMPSKEDVENKPATLKLTDYNTRNKASEAVTKSTKGFIDGSIKPIEKKIVGSNLSQIHIVCEDENLEECFDTQIVKDFENTIYTEDFSKDATPKCKRTGSPILSCPKAKRRRKFKTPTIIRKIIAPNTIDSASAMELTNTYKFCDNYKKFKRHSLKSVDELNGCGNLKNIDPYIFKFQFETLLEFEFRGCRNDVDDQIWTTDDIKRQFIDSVNKKIIPNGWMENHLRLIIWKLISYEIRFTHVMENVCTVKNILEQLKYRYERELYNVERPALRKILERDEVSTKAMVLCVAAMYLNDVSLTSTPNNIQNIELLLSDGWYTVKASTDRMISKLICDRKIVVGTKLMICGAELLNCDQGIAPWEDTSGVRLKIFGNSTRRAKWDARLGFHGNGAILSRLSSVKPDGGKVTQLRVLITRVYPTLYIEKFPDGSTLTRSERLEQIRQTKHENERQTQMEKIYEELEKFADRQESQDSEGMCTNKENGPLESGSQISRLMKRSRDRDGFRADLTNTQEYLLEQHTIKKKDKLLEGLQKKFQDRVKELGLDVPRNVVPLMKMRVADVENGNITKGMITIWRPNEVLQEMLTEGVWIDLYNVVPTSVRNFEVQISGGRRSVFHKSKLKETDKLKPYSEMLKRQCHTIKDLQNPSITTDYNEVDTVGLIFLVEPHSKAMANQPFQNVYLTDADKNIICVNFWGGINKFGFENVLDTGQIVACVNLQKRAGNTWKNVQQFRATEFTYFTKTSKIDSVKKMADDLTIKFNSIDKRKFMGDCVVLKNNYCNTKYGNTEKVSPYRLNTSDYNVHKNKVFIESPLLNKCTDVNLNLTGLDFNSSFKQIDTEELSPQTVIRKRKVNEKIAKLKMYGEPPPISPIHIINKSTDATKQFQNPFTKNDTSIVASSGILPHNSKEKSCDILPQIEKEFNISVTSALPQNTLHCNVDSSPVLSLNRTYVKEPSINPVKLNFSNMEQQGENNLDPFAEDFDSPPLSLE